MMQAADGSQPARMGKEKRCCQVAQLRHQLAADLWGEDRQDKNVLCNLLDRPSTLFN